MHEADSPFPPCPGPSRSHIPNYDNAELCWSVVDTATCNTPAKFCYSPGCQTNVFGAANKCCPATFVNPLSPLSRRR